MFRHTLSRLAYSAVAAGVLAFAAGPAYAQKGGGHGGGHGGGGHEGGGHGGEHGSSGWHGGGGWSGGSNWGWGGYGYFPYYYGGFGRGLFWGGYPYSYGGYYGDYGYSPWGSSYYSDYPPDAGYATAPDAAAPSASQQTVGENAVMIGVRVPENAQVWIDGQKTSQTGAFREFVTPSLEPGRPYHYDIRARWTQNGQEVLRDRQLSFHAGDRLMVNMLAPQQSQQPQAQQPAPIPRPQPAPAEPKP